MIVEISIPNVPDFILLVPDDEAEALRSMAVQRRGNPGRVWSFGEVSALKARGVTTEEAQKLAEVKQLLHASALWVRPGKAQREADAAYVAQSGLAFE